MECLLNFIKVSSLEHLAHSISILKLTRAVKRTGLVVHPNGVVDRSIHKISIFLSYRNHKSAGADG